MSTLLQKMVMDHLPGGKFWDPSGGLIEESTNGVFSPIKNLEMSSTLVAPL
jgi:hypothetical protein